MTGAPNAGPALPFPHSFWIDPGRLLAGEHPAGATAAETRARLDALVGAGVTYFVDLTQPGEFAPYDHLLPTRRASDDRYVVYVRKAIRNHGVPDAPEFMAEILDYLAIALEVGHCVYVHCRTGVGRTHTVTGCWLRRTGLDGAAALGRANALRQANAGAGLSPRVPETEAQQRYVLEWREPGADFDAGLNLDAARALRDRYQGCMLGLACGDALGASTQFCMPGQFPPVTDPSGGGPWQLPPGAWTDDTAMNICLAESLLAQAGSNPSDQQHRYRRWRATGVPSSTGQCIGITAATAAALAGGTPAPGSGPADAQALLRAGPVALFAASRTDRLVPWVAEAVAVTHGAADVASAAQWYAVLLLAAIRGAAAVDLRSAAQTLWPAAASRPANGFAARAVDAVLESVATAASFRDGLLRIVNRGGDADIHGALYGQLAGALYGAQGIPKAWRRALQGRAMLEDLADRLLAAALVPRE
jgi:ADP-ribosyl-[dinitrogen reductase] hydrolase